ncbi:hypothetical protein G3576_15065 [Roseomonas stagni]|uniref:Glycosyltransferase RgtA/B/C/D-like domain-containing protein n=1 Tax=Falsiroseomonas algicola TaxID=2716930 RepID=A0A6M1LMR1_9PROT|nr:hypothetical protein [Falsiroseomonas algicola]NGM21342.1 hypothetical protein [Falsiroseomonas algicola]
MYVQPSMAAPPALLAPRDQGWRGTALVVLASLAAALAALLAFGPMMTPDSPSYLAYAEALRAGPLPAGEALLRQASSPATLFRTPGYPAVIAALQVLAPERWVWGLVVLQMAAQAALAGLAHRVALALGLRGAWAVAAALMPAVGVTLAMQVAVMTDALYGALAGGAGLLLLKAGLGRGSLTAVALAGAMLGIGLLVREATAYLVLAFLPAAVIAAGRGASRRILGAGLLLAPVLLAAGWLMEENLRRSGHAVLSTTKQIVMVQAVLPLLARGVPVFDGDDLFDRTVREHVVPRGYQGLDAMNDALFAAGMTAPEIAAVAGDRYWRAWQRHPLEMLRAMVVRAPVKLFQIGFMPVDAVAELHLRFDRPRPWFGRIDAILDRLKQGSPMALAALVTLAGSRAIALLLAGAAMLAPLLLRRDPRFLPLLGAWLVCGGFLGVYLPVHVEQRYLMPVAPLLVLIGMVVLSRGAQAIREARHLRP